MFALKYLFVILVFFFISCGDETSTSSFESENISQDSVIVKFDTITKYDTILKIDSIAKYDTIIKIDTLIEYDTLYISLINSSSSSDLPKSYIDTINIVFFGNSLLFGYSSFGMSASDPSQDYYTKVNNSLRAKGIYTNSKKVAAGDFESLIDSTEQDAFLVEKLYPIISKNTDYVFLQIGDNINTDSRLENLERTMNSLIKGVAERGSLNTKIYSVATWYKTNYTNQARSIIEDQSNLNGINFIDISAYNTKENQSYIGQVVYRPTVKTYHIAYDHFTEIACTLTITFTISGITAIASITPDSWYADEENKVLTWTGHEYIVDNTGIASHPGDKGFTAIADAMVNAIMTDYEQKD